MKSVVLIICVTAGLASCKKTYTCHCEESVWHANFYKEHTGKVEATEKTKDETCYDYMEKNYREQYGSQFNCTASN